MKWSKWPTAILVTFITFGLLMLIMAIFAWNHQSSLVVTDYYKSEIEFQKRINSQQRFDSLQEKPIVTINSNFLLVHFPQSLRETSLAGNILFYKASNDKEDFKQLLAINKDGNQMISIKNLTRGKWKVKLDFCLNNKSFYNESDINL